MTTTLIAIISVFMGIFGGIVTPFIFKKYDLGFSGNTIVGVFGSIFFIKSLGRLGISPNQIIHNGYINPILLSLNLLISVIGGSIAVLLIYKLKTKLNPSLNIK